MEGLTRKLSEYIANETFQTIPVHIKAEIKRRILDYCGVVLAGSIRMESKILHKIMKEMGGVEEATFFGFGDKTSCMNAALANGTTSHITELGDWTKYLMHPGETMLSAAFARLASLPMMQGDFPPSSSVTGVRFSAAARMTRRPTSVDPV